jgi:hypothetical protein
MQSLQRTEAQRDMRRRLFKTERTSLEVSSGVPFRIYVHISCSYIIFGIPFANENLAYQLLICRSRDV